MASALESASKIGNRLAYADSLGGVQSWYWGVGPLRKGRVAVAVAVILFAVLFTLAFASLAAAWVYGHGMPPT